MRKISKIFYEIICIALITVCTVNVASALPVKYTKHYDDTDSNDSYNTYYSGFAMGINAVTSTMKFEKDFGGGLFAKHTAGVNPFIQVFPHKNFGLQIGGEWYSDASRKAYISAHSQLAGMPVLALGVPPIGFFVLNTKIKQWYIPFNVIVKIIIKDNYFMELAPGVSVSRLKVAFSYLADENSYLSGSDIFSKTKIIPIFRMVFGYKFNNDFSIQALVGCRNSSKFSSMISKDVIINRNAIINSENSFNYGIGISYLFI